MKTSTNHFFARLAVSTTLLFLFCVGRASAQSDYTAITVENGGTITGTVKWSGATPKAPKLPITKDASVCDPESHKVRDLERLEVGADGGVANTVVFLKDITKGKARDLPDTRKHLDQRKGKACQRPDTRHNLDQRNSLFLPPFLRMPQGDTTQAKSPPPVLHTVQ